MSKSYSCLGELHTVRIPQENETVNGKITQYMFPLTRVTLQVSKS